MAVVVLVILIVFSLLLFSVILMDRRGRGPLVHGCALPCGCGVNAYYWVLPIPHRITVAEDGYIEFICLVRWKSLAARDIRSITPEAGQIGIPAIRTDQGNVRILNEFDGFQEFIAFVILPI